MSHDLQILEKETQSLIAELTEFHAFTFRTLPTTNKHRTRAAAKDASTSPSNETTRLIHKRLEDFKITFHNIITRIEAALNLEGIVEARQPNKDESSEVMTAPQHLGHKEVIKDAKDMTKNPAEVKKTEDAEEVAEKQGACKAREAHRKTHPKTSSVKDGMQGNANTSKSVMPVQTAPRATSKTLSVGTKSQHEATPAPLRYRCQRADLGRNLVSTIMEARAQLGKDNVDTRGYLILTTDVVLNSSDMEEILRTAKEDKTKYVYGFHISSKMTGYLEAHVDNTVSLDIQPTLDSNWSNSDAHDSESDFQAWVDQPVQKVRYLIGPPWIQDHFGNHLLSAGSSMERRQPIPGVNQPYWYLSLDAHTPASVHIEDANTGSANILLYGADKQWQIIHPASAEKFEKCIREEFRQSKNCTQFVRHHNIILSPTWLRERGILFEIEHQRAGEIFCTMPGRVYHAVSNTGCNFAIAQNFEFPDAPEVPVNYKWCQRGKGRKSCGEQVMTLQDYRFQTKPMEGDIANAQESRDAMAKVFCISDDDEKDTRNIETESLLRLPRPATSTSRDVQNIIDACLDQNMAPSWLGCQDKNELRAKLHRFMPGEWLDDDLLLKLLRMIAFPMNYYVADPLGVDIAVANAVAIRKILERAGTGVRGVVMPFNVSLLQQSRPTQTLERNHWVVGVFDHSSLTFTGFDIEDSVAQKWACALGEALTYPGDELRRVHTVTKTMPVIADPGSCGFCCCLAMEGFFGGLPLAKQNDVRSYYLRRLLTAFRLSVQNGNILDTSMSIVRRTINPVIAKEVQASKTESHSNLLEYAFSKEQLDAETAKNIESALMEDTMTIGRRWRILQAIMQCSRPNLEHLVSASKALTSTSGFEGSNAKRILTLVEKLGQTSSQFFLPALQHRIHLVELHIAFERQVQHETTAMRQRLAMRKRMSASGEKLSPLTNSGMSPKNRALDMIIAAEIDDPTCRKRLRKRMETYTTFGSNLKYMAMRLGLGLLLALPACTVHQCDFRLRLSNMSRDNECIEPSQYYSMSEEEMGYFIRWLPMLQKAELQEWDEAWTDALLPGSRLWNLYEQTNDNLSTFLAQRPLPQKRRRAASRSSSRKREVIGESFGSSTNGN